MRTWTNAKTGEVVRGAYLAARSVDGAVKVSMERENGDVVVFPLAELAEADRTEAQRQIDQVKAINERLAVAATAGVQSAPQPGGDGRGTNEVKPPQAAPFDLFAPFVKTRWDDRWLYVESDGLPHEPWAYPLMVGIESWQQQVPLPQAYTGNNAWQIPLKPELADKPISGKTQLYRGAIALAANGVPIFNALNNRGDDTFKVGELDEYGGHAGRGDDYHYHIAPLALQKIVGKDKPIAYALDGFPLYGLFDPAAKKGEDKSCPLAGTETLDELNGHFGLNAAGSKGLYHYHASIAYPYINGGVRGKVTVNDDQIDPQPRANPVRQWLQPVRGASITGFKTLAERSWSLEYTASGNKHLVNFRIEDGGGYVFDFVDPDGTKKTETYTARPPRDRPAGDNPPQRDGRDGPPGDRQPPRGNAQADQLAAPKAAESDFRLTSPDVIDGRLNIDCTCDGEGRAPVLRWGVPPKGTEALAVVMHHVPPDGETHVYMVVANLPASSRELSAGSKAAGIWGPNTVNRRNAYTPPCSKGPGDKEYTITLYALSAQVEATEGDLSRDALLAEIEGTTLATATLDVRYARQGSGAPEAGQPQNGSPQEAERPRRPGADPQVVKPSMDDTISAVMYADNWFVMYINGKQVAVDSIDFLPHNVVAVDLLPEYPMTIAVLAKDNADPETGCEYGNRIGDGGFILKFGDGTVTDASWKAKTFMHGPVNRDTTNPTVRTTPLPDRWFGPELDDSEWPHAAVYPQSRIDPKEPFFQHDFSGAKWIWTEDLDLDNTVVFRTRIERPDWKPRWTTKPDLRTEDR